MADPDADRVAEAQRPAGLGAHQDRALLVEPHQSPRRRRTGERALVALPEGDERPRADEPADLAVEPALEALLVQLALEQEAAGDVVAPRSIDIASRSRALVQAPSSSRVPAGGGSSPPPTALSSARWQRRSG